MSDTAINKKQFQTIWKEIISLFDDLFEAAEAGIERHSDLFNDIPDHEKLEQHLIKDVFAMIQKKWTLEIANALAFHNFLYFNGIKNHLGKISSKTLSERLKELIELQLISREVEADTAPVRVKYTLTEYGKGLHHSLLPFIIYFFQFK